MSEGARRVGRLRHRVRVEQNTQASRDDYGQLVPESWTTVATIWADISPVNQSEADEAGRVEGRRLHNVYIHYNSQIKSGMRLVMIADGNRVLNIESVRDIGERRRGMELRCVEVEGVTV